MYTFIRAPLAWVRAQLARTIVSPIRLCVIRIKRLIRINFQPRYDNTYPTLSISLVITFGTYKMMWYTKHYLSMHFRVNTYQNGRVKRIQVWTQIKRSFKPTVNLQRLSGSVAQLWGKCILGVWTSPSPISSVDVNQLWLL